MGTFQRGNPKDILNSQPKSIHCEFPTEENPKQERFAFDTGLGNQCYHFVEIQDFLLMYMHFGEKRTPQKEVQKPAAGLSSRSRETNDSSCGPFSFLLSFSTFEIGRINSISLSYIAG